jgi:hypothetical protein
MQSSACNTPGLQAGVAEAERGGDSNPEREERRSKMLVKFNDPEEFLEELT